MSSLDEQIKPDSIDSGKSSRDQENLEKPTQRQIWTAKIASLFKRRPHISPKRVITTAGTVARIAVGPGDEIAMPIITALPHEPAKEQVTEGIMPSHANSLVDSRDSLSSGSSPPPDNNLADTLVPKEAVLPQEKKVKLSKFNDNHGKKFPARPLRPVQSQPTNSSKSPFARKSH